MASVARFPVVLFDLDGTVVDSGAIILASMRHATREVLGAEGVGIDPAPAAYVGDSPFDIRAAKAAGMYAVAVTWGRIHDRSRLEREEPDAIANTAEELLELL